MTTHKASDTLVVETDTKSEGGPYIIIERVGCSLVIVRLSEVRRLIAALNNAAVQRARTAVAKAIMRQRKPRK